MALMPDSYYHTMDNLLLSQSPNLSFSPVFDGQHDRHRSHQPSIYPTDGATQYPLEANGNNFAMLSGSLGDVYTHDVGPSYGQLHYGDRDTLSQTSYLTSSNGSFAASDPFHLDFDNSSISNNVVDSAAQDAVQPSIQFAKTPPSAFYKKTSPPPSPTNLIRLTESSYASRNVGALGCNATDMQFQ